METKIENSFLTVREQQLLLKIALLFGVDLLFVMLSATLLIEQEGILTRYVPFMSVVFLFLYPAMIIWVKKKGIHSLILYSVLLFSGAAGFYLFNITLWMTAVILLFLHWRVGSYFQSEDDQIDVSSPIILGFLCLSAFSLIIGNARDLGNGMIILTLILLMFSLVSTVTSFQRMLIGGTGEGSSNKRNLMKPFAVLLVVLAAGGVLSVFSSYARMGFYWILNKVFWLFSFLVNPLFALLVKVRDWIMSKISRDTLSGFGLKLPEEKLDEAQQAAFYDGMSYPWLNEILIAVFILGVIIYFIKKKKIAYEVETGGQMSPLMSKFKKRELKQKEISGAIHYSAAGNAIRQAVKELEKEAAAKKIGRKPNENIRAWFFRMGLNEDEAFFKLYETVRYGTKIPDEKEVSSFVKRTKEHMTALNDRDR
ncbi:hypothetical protein AS034_09340 [[Bacillus] enclensis]|uniref:DUF4129 domain-containing protein n=1 Tax=[Bacillus] enclensis TaxID=1402860 RepID=A0A0V8HJI7_9BACI|nr:hypothetical protein [[Bacillus] enclensis]KSU62320.1 hypothetical protein AS034_09340 [[Bacillus] enclensis]SCC02618.1 hypothetical protein GA0061094_1940 [[Bacillus] enclensis]